MIPRYLAATVPVLFAIVGGCGGDGNPPPNTGGQSQAGSRGSSGGHAGAAGKAGRGGIGSGATGGSATGGVGGGAGTANAATGGSGEEGGMSGRGSGDGGGAVLGGEGGIETGGSSGTGGAGANAGAAPGGEGGAAGDETGGTGATGGAIGSGATGGSAGALAAGGGGGNATAGASGSGGNATAGASANGGNVTAGASGNGPSGGATGTAGTGTGGGELGGTGTGAAGAGTSGAGGGSNTCVGALAPDCACVRVTPDGDDALAASGAAPFRNVEPAILFAASHASITSRVCVAGGATCADTATYSGPAAADLSLLDGVELYGNYESTSWTRCGNASKTTTLAPTTASGVSFGPDVTTGAVLDGFAINRFAASTTNGVTVRGARGVRISSVAMQSANGNGTEYGFVLSDGAEATLDAVSVVRTLPYTQDFTLGLDVGVHATNATVGISNSTFSFYTLNQAYGVWLEDVTGSSVTSNTIQLQGTSGFPSGSAVGIHVARAGAGIRLDDNVVNLSGGGSGTGIELANAGDTSLLRAQITVPAQLQYGVHAVGSRLSATGNLTAPGGGSAINTGVWLEDGGDSDLELNIQGSGLEGIHVTGASDGTLIRGSVDVYTPLGNVGPAGYAKAVRIDGCNGGNVAIEDTAVLVALGPPSAPVEGVSVAGDCHVSIRQNARIVAASGADSGLGQNVVLNGIHCSADCNIADNANVFVDNTHNWGSHAFATANGILCDGTCEITENHVAGLQTPPACTSCTVLGNGVSTTGTALVARNRINAGCSGNGAALRAQSGRIENNVLLGPTCGASEWDSVVLYSQGTYTIGAGLIAYDADVHSNTIAAGGAGSPLIDQGIVQSYRGYVSFGVLYLGSNGRYRNNIIGGSFVEAGALGSSQFPRGGSPSAFENNDLRGGYLDDTPNNGFPYTTLTLAQVNTQIGHANLSADPLLDSDSHLTQSSPCVDAGTLVGAPTNDIDGDTRDASSDIGADEWTGAPSACRGVDCSERGVCQAGACTCDPGYVGSRCEGIDQCATANGGCDPLTQCTPFLGGHSCGPCPAGYTGDGSTGCVDIDECLTNNGGCDPLTACTNTTGGRSCGACPAGYLGNGETGCTPTTVCSPNPCQHGGTCSESASGYACACSFGNPGSNCEGELEQLALGGRHSCGLLNDGSVFCWGDSSYGQTTPPSGDFVQVAALNSDDYCECGLLSSGQVTCWGLCSDPPPADTLSALSKNTGIRTDGTLLFWGSTTMGLNLVPSGTFEALSTGLGTACAIRTDGTLACWGAYAATPPIGTFVKVRIGTYHGCGIRSDGTVACWGYNASGQATPPSGTFSELAASTDTTCGIRTNGSITCWGQAPPSSPPATGSYHAIDMRSDGSGCAVNSDGVLACWNKN